MQLICVWTRILLGDTSCAHTQLPVTPAGNPAAVGEYFNCATDKLVTYDQVAQLVMDTVGNKVDIVHYDPEDFDLPKGAFPFRNTAFYVDVEKAKSTLGWLPKCTLQEDMSWYYADYKALGREKRQVDFMADEMVRSCGTHERVAGAAVEAKLIRHTMCVLCYPAIPIPGDHCAVSTWRPRPI